MHLIQLICHIASIQVKFYADHSYSAMSCLNFC
nr:MAG TPA: hypothetical protein [Caudoviricetes sp.]DAW32077.1 MAG TPA: hypothetical protein [Caudoviricetes sp.]